MATSEDFVRRALTEKGADYVFGAETSPLDPHPDKIDCSELVQWTGEGLGLTVPDGSFNQWPWSRHVPLDQGITTRGALLFIGTRATVHHVAISLGDGTTIEARGRAYGVGTWGAAGRFDGAGLVPGLTYIATPAGTKLNRGGGVNLGIGPNSSTQATTFAQNMLNIIRGYHHTPLIKVDGVYGDQTKAAVAEFQQTWNASPFGKANPIPHTGGIDPKTGAAISYTIGLIFKK